MWHWNTSQNWFSQSGFTMVQINHVQKDAYSIHNFGCQCVQDNQKVVRTTINLAPLYTCIVYKSQGGWKIREKNKEKGNEKKERNVAKLSKGSYKQNGPMRLGGSTAFHSPRFSMC